MNTVLTCAQLGTEPIRDLLARFGLELVEVPVGQPIPGTWFGEPEAGIVGRCVYVRPDTPVHSAMHETCHLICMDETRRSKLDSDAGGDYEEENGVNYMQLLLAEFLPGMGRERMLADMDRWGYTYRLGSAQAWWEEDAVDARNWLFAQGLIDSEGHPRWRLRI